MSNNGMGSASVINFSNYTGNLILPKDDLYVDTNSLMDISFGRTHGQAVENYLKQFVAQQGIHILLWSDALEDEIEQCIQVDEYIAEARNRNMQQPEKNWKSLENSISVPDANLLHQRARSRRVSLKAKFGNAIYPIEASPKIRNTADAIATTYGVPIKDARHLAYMWQEETNNLVTRDKRFANIPGLNIYSPEMQTNNVPPYNVRAFMPHLPQSLKND